MDNTPNEAPAAAQAVESVATPNTNENTVQAPAMPDMHGFTSEATENINSTNNGGSQGSGATLDASLVAEYLGTDTKTLEEFTRFTNANDKFNKAFQVLKSRTSNPEPKNQEQPVQAQAQTSVQQQPVAQSQQPMRTPDGMLSRNDLLMRGYYERLAGEEEYKPIAKEITNGDVLKEMEMLGINPTDSNGFIDDKKIRAFLSIKAKTVPASQANSMPEASPAPTVDYIQVGDTIENMAQARAVIMQDSQLRASGQAGHPSVAKAEEFLRNALNKNNK